MPELLRMPWKIVDRGWSGYETNDRFLVLAHDDGESEALVDLQGCTHLRMFNPHTGYTGYLHVCDFEYVNTMLAALYTIDRASWTRTTRRDVLELLYLPDDHWTATIDERQHIDLFRHDYFASGDRKPFSERTPDDAMGEPDRLHICDIATFQQSALAIVLLAEQHFTKVRGGWPG